MEEKLEGINDTGAEEKFSEPGEDTFIPPTIDSETGELIEGKEEKREEEKGEDVIWEKRYKDLQAQKDREVTRYKKLLAPFEKDIRESETGDLYFEFPDTTSKEEGIPTLPTDEEWAVNPATAADKFYNYREHQRQQKERAEWERQDAEEADREYADRRSQVWAETQEIYPDTKNPESALFRHANEILESDTALQISPYCDLIAVRLAATDLGIKPIKRESPQSRTEKRDTSYIISGKTGSGGKSSGHKLSESEFLALSDQEQAAYLEKEALG